MVDSLWSKKVRQILRESSIEPKNKNETNKKKEKLNPNGNFTDELKLHQKNFFLEKKQNMIVNKKQRDVNSLNKSCSMIFNHFFFFSFYSTSFASVVVLLQNGYTMTGEQYNHGYCCYAPAFDAWEKLEKRKSVADTCM